MKIFVIKFYFVSEFGKKSKKMHHLSLSLEVGFEGDHDKEKMFETFKEVLKKFEIKFCEFSEL